MSDILDSFPVETQQRIVSSGLHGQIVHNAITGIYTVVYAWTMYLYMSRNGRSQRVVVWAISVLYALYLIDWILQCHWMNQAIVVNGATRGSIFISIVASNSPSLFAFDNFTFYSGFALSDALWIWRCYHVWGMSLRVILVPLTLLVIEAGIIITSTVLNSSFGTFGNDPWFALMLNCVVSALVFVSLGTTVITTFLISYRIHSVTRLNRIISKNRFKYILMMIVESAAVSSIILLLLAISSSIPSFSKVASPEYTGQMYIDSLANGISGMAPTILMARLAVKSPDTDPISAPTFMPQDLPDLACDSAPGVGEDISQEDCDGARGKTHPPMIQTRRASEASVHEAVPEKANASSTGGLQGV